MKFHEPQGGLVDGWRNCLGITWWLQHHVGRMDQNACALSRFTANDGQCMAFWCWRAAGRTFLVAGLFQRLHKKLGFLPRRCGGAVPLLNKTVKPALSGAGHSTGAGDVLGIHKGTGIVILSIFLESYRSLSSYLFLYFWENIIKLGKWVHSWTGNYFHNRWQNLPN